MGSLLKRVLVDVLKAAEASRRASVWKSSKPVPAPPNVQNASRLSRKERLDTISGEMLGVGIPLINAGVLSPEFMAELIDDRFWGGVLLLSRLSLFEFVLLTELAFIKSSVRLFLVPRGLPARFDSLYTQRSPDAAHPAHGVPREHFTFARWQELQACRNFFARCSDATGV